MRGRLVVTLAILVAGGLGFVWLRSRRDDAAAPTRPASGVGSSAEAQLAGRAPVPLVPTADRPQDGGRWIAALASREPADVEEAFRVLRNRLRAGHLTLDETLDIVLIEDLEGAPARLQTLARRHLAELGPDAIALLPRLLDLSEAGAGREVSTASYLISRLAGASGYGDPAPPPADVGPRPPRAAVRPFLSQITALVADEETNKDTRFAMLALLHVLGGEAAHVAPALIAWIESILAERQEYEQQHPLRRVSWTHYEFGIAATLGALGPDALPVILAAYRNEQTLGNYMLLRAIEDMDEEALPALRPLLHDPDAALRAVALRSIARLTKGDPQTLALLRETAHDPSPRMRAQALALLRAHGVEAARELLNALADEDDNVREAALDGLAELPGVATEVLPRLVSLLEEGSYGERHSAVRALTALGPSAVDATPLVLRLLTEDVERWEQLSGGWYLDDHEEALRAFGTGVVPYLVAALRGTDAKARHAILTILPRLDYLTLADLAPLAAVLPGLAGVARMQLAALLAGHGDQQATDELMRGLKSTDPAVRMAAAEGLHGAGPTSVAALGDLVAGLRVLHAALKAERASQHEAWEPYYAHFLAVEHVGSFAPERILPLLRDADETIREAAAGALSRARERGLAVLEPVWHQIPALGRIEAVKRIGAGAFRAKDPWEAGRPFVLAALDDTDPRVRLAAARAIRGDDLRPRAIATWIDLLASNDRKVVSSASYALRQRLDDLVPFETQLREVQPRANERVRGDVQEMLDAIEAAR